MRTYHPDHTLPTNDRDIWVFGSNLAGIHGAGAAEVAHQTYGYPMGKGYGRADRAYAIPTKDALLRSLSIDDVATNILWFLDHAKQRPQDDFFVTAIGCGYAGFQHRQIAPLFIHATPNCSFPDVWRPYLDG